MTQGFTQTQTKQHILSGPLAKIFNIYAKKHDKFKDGSEEGKVEDWNRRFEMNLGILQKTTNKTVHLDSSVLCNNSTPLRTVIINWRKNKTAGTSVKDISKWLGVMEITSKKRKAM